MASNSGFDAQKLFELYLHDYLVKNNMHETAEAFRKEVDVDASHPVAINVPDGFLHEWWCIFHDFAAGQLKHQESPTETCSEVRNMSENQPLHPMVPQLTLDQQRSRQFPVSTNYDLMIGEPTYMLAAKFQEGEQFPHSFHLPQQIHTQAHQRIMRDNLQDFDFVKTTLMDPALYDAPRAILEPGLHGPGLNGGVNSMPSNIWHLDAPNHPRQFQAFTTNHEQKTLASTQSFTSGNLIVRFPGTSKDFAYHNVMVPKTDLSGRNAQMAVPKRQPADCQLQHELPQHQQSQEKSRRRNKSSHSKAKDKSLDIRKDRDSKPASRTVESVLSHDAAVDSSTGASNKNKRRAS